MEKRERKGTAAILTHRMVLTGRTPAGIRDSFKEELYPFFAGKEITPGFPTVLLPILIIFIRTKYLWMLSP